MAGTQIARPDDVRRQNRRLVLEAARRMAAPSRTELVAHTGLSPSTISAITSALITEGVLIEQRDQDAPSRSEVNGGRRGRPQVRLGLNPEAATVAVVVLAINHLSVALVDYAGATIAEKATRVPTLSADGDALIATVIAALEECIAKRPKAGRRLMHISMGVQGVTDAAGTTMLWSPIVREKDIAFGPALEQRFRVPVMVSNDCSMIAEALRWAEPEHYGSNFAAVLLSHGIGMGLRLNGRAFTGVRSSAAEFGHMVHVPGGARCRCGRHGCIEAYAGDYAILRTAEGGSADDEPASDVASSDICRLAEEARHGSEPAQRAFRDAGRAIGYGLGSLFSLTDPVPVALVGPGAVEHDLIEAEIRDGIGQSTSWEDARDIAIHTYSDEHPLIVQGCMMTSLLYLDANVFAAGEVPATGLKEAG